MSSTLGLLEVVSNLPGADMVRVLVRVLVRVKVRHGARGRGLGKVGVGVGAREKVHREAGEGTGRDAGQLGAVATRGAG